MGIMSRALCIALLATATPFEAPPAHAAVTKNRLVGNRLIGNRLIGNRLAASRLAGNALTSTSLEASAETAEILQTVEGRDVFSYLIGCALPFGLTIEATVPGAPDTAPPDTNYTCAAERCFFAGELGLAEDWIDHKLASKDERWISACMIARVNANDTAEAISLRGAHPGLAVSPDEAGIYNVEEGAFYGNLFTHEDDPIDWNACRGAGQASGEFGGLALRDCAEEDPGAPGRSYCGFNYAGDCRDYSPQFPSPYACKSFDLIQTVDGLYGDCHTASGDGHWPSSKTYRPARPPAGWNRSKGTWHAPNRAQGFRTYFSDDGLHVVPRRENPPSWQWGLRFGRIGRGQTVIAAERAVLTPRANRINYDRGPCERRPYAGSARNSMFLTVGKHA